MSVIDPNHLLSAYAQGIFPMADSKDAEEVNWYQPKRRGIIPLDEFHVSSNVQRIIRQGRLGVRVDTCFRQVMEACADRKTSWINPLILDSYEYLHELGYAHSVEMWKDDDLVGGLYGVHLKSAFFGESMFKKEKEADKVALYFCHQILKENGFRLWDTQYYTDHLGRFGCKEIPANEYDDLLTDALKTDSPFRLSEKVDTDPTSAG